MKQKLFSLLLAIAASVGTMFAWDYERVQIGDLYYNLDGTNQTAEITSQNSSSPFWSTPITTADIPASVTYNNVKYSVISIGKNAFHDCTGLTSVEIPNSVISIGIAAFHTCSGLASITIPDSVNNIEGSAFYKCTGLNSITIPNSVTSIGGSAFYGCTGLTYVTIGNSVTSIGDYTFSGCTRLTSVTIGNNVRSIGDYAFHNCSGLTSVTIPNNVTSIGNNAFKNCSNITSVVWNAKNCTGWNFGSQVESFTFGNEVEVIPSSICQGMTTLTTISIPNSVTSIGDEAFNGCSGLTSLTLNSNAIASKAYSSSNNLTAIFGAQVTQYSFGEGVTAIGDYALYNAANLPTVTIPSSVVSIGNQAFSNCSQLATVNINSNAVVSKAYTTTNNFTTIFGTQVQTYNLGEAITAIGDYAFYGNDLSAFTIPESVTQIGNSAFRNCAGSSFDIPASVKNIGNKAFADCADLETMTIRGATNIGEGAFSVCTGLTSLQLGNSLTSIGDSAFSNCYNLPSVEFPNSLQTIGNYAFYQCNKIPSVTIPESVTALGEGAFKACSKLTNVTINSNTIASKAYTSSSNLTSVFGSQVTQYVFGEGVTAIGNNAMYHTVNMEVITIPSSILSIGQSAIDGCSQLETVNLNSNAIVSKTYTATNNFSTIFGSQVQTYNLGDAITAIGDYAFYNCGNATTLNIPDGVTTIGNNSFAGCSGVTSLVIPESVTSIGNDAFRECTGVETLTLPNVTTIGNSAFADCSNLTSLQLGNNLTTIGDSTFSSCYNLQAIAFPSTMKTIGNYAFYQCNRFTAIDIPASITFLGDGAFKGCTKLTTVSIKSNAVMSKTYSSTSNLSTIFGSQVQSFTLSDAVTAIGDYAFYNCTSLPTITIPSNVTKIGGSAFYGCTGLKSMIIPENITSIESNTFHGCTALSSVNLPNTITSIKDSAFFNCSSLQLESLPSAVSTLGKGAFSGCGSLASIAMPASLTSVGENAFNDCSGIAEVKIENVDSWCKIDFGNSKSNPVFYSRNLYIGDSLIAELTIPNKITELKPWTFVNCNSINSVFIPNTVRLFSPSTFNNCENIASVEWHAKNIADYASSAASPFYASRSKITSFVFGEETEHIPSHLCNGMSKINLLSFPSNLKSIGDYSFKDLTKIRKINIPNEVTSIGAHAFDSCILVTSIYLGYQVEEIGDYAFKGCIRVNDITSMNTTTPVVYENTLSSISDYAYLYVPAGSKRTYQLDPYWGRFDIREIASEDATLSKDAVTVEANEDNAIFTWPTDSAAASYSLQITKDGVVFCTLIFNSNGQLTGIAFAPGRNGAAHAPAATMSVAGMSFTVTGLDGASKYAYRLAVTNDASEELVAYSGEFATTGYDGEVNPGGNPEGIEDVFTDEHKASKILHNCQIFILRGEKVYTIDGRKVR